MTPKLPPNPHPRSHDMQMYTDSLSSRSHPKSDIRNPKSTQGLPFGRLICYANPQINFPQPDALIINTIFCGGLP